MLHTIDFGSLCFGVIDVGTKSVTEVNHYNTAKGRETEYSFPSRESDKYRRNQINDDRAEGTSSCDDDTCLLVLFQREEIRHKLDHRRPHECLGKAVDTPHDQHQYRALTERYDVIHQGGRDQSVEDQLFRAEAVSADTAEDLAGTVCGKAACKCKGER